VRGRSGDRNSCVSERADIVLLNRGTAASEAGLWADVGVGLYLLRIRDPLPVDSAEIPHSN